MERQPDKAYCHPAATIAKALDRGGREQGVAIGILRVGGEKFETCASKCLNLARLARSVLEAAAVLLAQQFGLAGVELVVAERLLV